MTSSAVIAGAKQTAVALAATAVEPVPGERGNASLQPGTVISQYELIRELGSGGMGTVFLARDTRLGRLVAIKFLHTTDADLTRRFILEARATANCNHENIVVIHEVGEYRRVPFMVLEYLSGQSLKTYLAGQQVPAARAVELIVPVVRALVCAHARNVIHRDLKPDNILVTDSGTIKVLDFGIAKVLQAAEQTASSAEPASDVDARVESSTITQEGTILGTFPYMAPEQWGISNLDQRVDIWATGIVLFQMLAGRHPLAPLQGRELMVTRELDVPMPSLREIAPDAPPELADVVDRCLRKRRDERYPDAASLLHALEQMVPGRALSGLRDERAPYAGLRAFQESDADRFFGRDREVTALVNRLRDRPVMAVVGPSGVGKSSFVRAGVVPALKRSGESWEALILRPGPEPLQALAATIAPLTAPSSTAEGELQVQRALVERLRAEPGYVGAVLRSHARRKGGRLLLFVDQTEELYTQVADSRERLAFTACLAGIADDATAPARVIVSLRSDFLDRVSEDQRFMAEVTPGLFFLTPPQAESLRDALVRPAELAGYRFETTELVERMLQHLQSVQGALPLLQFTAARLWDARDQSGRVLTERGYTEMGGIEGALATYAESVLAVLSLPEQALVRELLLRLVTSERTRVLVPVEELQKLSPDAELMQRLIQHLVQARLLVTQVGSGGAGAMAEIVHESLIHGWPTLRRWLDESQEDAVFLEHLRLAARQWQLKHMDQELIWRGKMAEEAQRFKDRYQGKLPPLQQDFLGAVLAGAAKAVRRRWMLMAGAGAVLLMVVVSVSSTVALVWIRRAQIEAEEQARVARMAEDEAKKNLRAAEEGEARRAIAQAEAENSRRVAEEQRRRAEESMAKLVQARRDAEAGATLARQRAEEARLAQEEERRAKEALQTKLDEEAARNRRWNLISDLKKPGVKQ